MRLMYVVLVVLIGWASLTAAAAEQDLELPQLTVPRLATAPTIDGTVAPGEWDRAGAATGFFHYLERQLADQQPVVLMGYDDDNLYLCYVVPARRGQAPTASVTKRDGPVHREDAVEFLLLPPDGKLRHLIVNAVGTVFDAFDGDPSFDGQWQIAAGRARERNLPAEFRAGFEAYWGVEMALSFAELRIAPPRPGEPWRVNLCIDGSMPRVLAPTFEKYAMFDRFATLRFAGEDEPFAALGTLGKPGSGRVALGGWAINPTSKEVQFHAAVRAQQAGTHTVEQTGFDEIVGAEARAEQHVTVPPGGRKAILLTQTMDDQRFDRLTVQVRVMASGAAPQLISRQQWAYQVRLPLRVTLQNYPSRRQAVLEVDATEIAELPADAAAHWSVKDAESREVLRGESILERGRTEPAIDYAALAPGRYRVQVALQGGGQAESIALAESELTHPGTPVWMNNDIGKAPRVLKPFAPLTFADDAVHAWRRIIAWDSSSILPARMTGADEPLLASPAKLVIVAEGKEAAFALSDMQWISREPHRAEFNIKSQAAGFTLTGNGWIEYDGLLWMDVTLDAGDQPREIQSLTLELPMPREQAKLYHGVPDRALTGPIHDQPLGFPFQYYFWLGNPKRGLGFAVESLKDFFPYDGQAMYDVIPRGDTVLWRVKFIQQPVRRKTVQYAFGLQATPVKPLPGDYHAWIGENYDTNADSFWRSPMRGEMDMAIIWNNRTRYMPAFCDPMNVDVAVVRKLTEQIHGEGVPALVYFAPVQFSEGAHPDHETFANEWMIHPRSSWNVAGFESVQVRASPVSSYVDFLLFGLQRTAREGRAAGFYFDGDMPLADVNPAHGAGWTDDQGKVHPTYPVLGIRRFMQRVAVMLEEEVEANPDVPRKDHGGPAYHLWGHVSGQVCPMTHSPATALLCGEWFKQPLRQGRTYAELLARDTFRPRYISEPWGIPNSFLAIATSHPERAREQSEAILAYILPQGVPLFPRYFDNSVRDPVLAAMKQFDSSHARYTPAWDENPVLKIDAPHGDVLLGAWDRDGRILAVISNVGDVTAEVDLHSRGTALLLKTIYPPAAPRANAAEAWRIAVPAHSFVMVLLEP